MSPGVSVEDQAEFEKYKTKADRRDNRLSHGYERLH